MKRNLIAILLLAALTLSMLAACGGEAKPSAVPGENKAAETTAAEAVETEAPPEYVKPDVDLSGQTFIFSTLEQLNPNWIARTYVEAARVEQNGDIINDAIYQRITDTEETLGVTVESAIYNEIATVVNATMAGDRYADCVLISGNNLRSVMPKNLLIDMNIITTLDFSKSWWDEKSVDAFSIGNKLYCASGDIATFGFLASYVTYINKGILANYNLDSPYDLVRNGQWTLDRAAEYSRAVASDLNGDGVMDGSDIFGYESEGGLGIVAATSMGVNPIRKDENDMPVLDMDTELAASIVEKFIPLCRDKSITLYSSDFASGYKNVFRQFITEMFIADKLLFVNNWMVVALELRNMDSDFGILPPCKFSESQSDYICPSSETWTFYATVPKTAGDLDMVGYVMDALGHFGKDYLHTALIDTTITSKALRDTDTEEMLDIVYNNRYYNLVTIYDWGGINGMFSNFISNNDTAFASKWASIEEKAVAAIQATLDSLE